MFSEGVRRQQCSQQVSFPWTPVAVLMELSVRLNHVFLAACTSFRARPKWCSKSCRSNNMQVVVSSSVNDISSPELGQDRNSVYLLMRGPQKSPQSQTGNRKTWNA